MNHERQEVELSDRFQVFYGQDNYNFLLNKLKNHNYVLLPVEVNHILPYSHLCQVKLKFYRC